MITARKLVRALLQEGFSFTRQRGSHQRYRHPDGRRVTIPFTRPGGTFAPGTLQSIIKKQAKWKNSDLKRLGLVK